MVKTSIGIAVIMAAISSYPIQGAERTVLVEEFTTQPCTNCPAAATNLKMALAQLSAEERDRVAVVCHHAGFMTDPFTLPCDEALLDFYMTDPQGAPRFMTDRTSKDGTGAPVFVNSGSSDIKARILERLAVPTEVSLNVTGTHEVNARRVKVTVTGTAGINLSSPRITVYLTEDGVAPKGAGQKGAGAGFTHSHVIRAYSSDWGEAPQLNGSDFTFGTTLTYPEECDPQNMQVVALYSNYDESDVLNRRVENAAKCGFSELSEDVGSGVEELCEEDLPYLYTIDGRRVENRNPSPGIYISGRRKILVR